ncbi:DUF4365 domain-containing protein [Oerskovia gallyi]|uniref:DUF4365 domain-containing protein n=1 Tax=Oerskovia gallyi TaxID=2762226 RepID=A0ABR8V4R1_9CELL|nr:DUF4365 domain-containing protein [Oerskovia gallyi]MBD7999546.1 DUF4365 domain-containing protein [Oerskovia gallyi]
MRAGATSPAGTSGASYITAALEEYGWAVVPHPQEHDIGTDLWVSPRDARRFDLGLMLGMQVKNGDSWFAEPATVGGQPGWWFRDSREHFEYWLHHSVPHVVVLRNPETSRAYWARVDAPSVVRTTKRGKLFIAEDQLLDATALAALTKIAAAVRPQPRWSGSAWAGAPDLAPEHELRYSLLAPRLVAPHPNARVGEISPTQAVALLTSGRFGEMDRYGLVESDARRSGWGWELFFALLDYVTEGRDELIHAALEGAKQPHERAAASAVAAAVLTESGKYKEALAALDDTLTSDEYGPIDHAWLMVHRARSLAEVGDPSRAIEAAVGTYALPAQWPEDVTAAAIAGSAAALVFRASDLYKGDVGSTISAGDNEASWWRAQMMSWGLGSIFDDSFRRWQDDGEVRFSRDTGTHRLRGASLTAGFTAHHDAWCHTTSLIARADLMDGTRDTDHAAQCLTDLVRAGDTKAVKRAISHLLEAGPADAITIAADTLNLADVTHTDARSAIELLARGADVLTSSAADAAARWALSADADLATWIERVRPSFIVEYKQAELLRELIDVVSPTIRAQIRARIVSCPALVDQGSAHEWAAVLAAIPVEEWDDDDAATLLARSGDNWEFVDALMPLRVRRDPATRSKNASRLRAGDLKALTWVGPIANVPADTAAPLITAAAAAIGDRLTQVRSGMYTRGTGIDAGRVLVLLNTQFPDQGDWSPILELLREPRASSPMLEATLVTIQWCSERIAESARTEICEALDDLVKRRRVRLPLFDRDVAPAAVAALDSLRPGALLSSRWIANQDGAVRRGLIHNLARRADPADLSALTVLAGDIVPRTRATAAAALSRWVENDVALVPGLDAIRGLLADEGTLIARYIVGQWSDEPSEPTRQLAAELLSHRSATVRAAARTALAERAEIPAEYPN